MRSFRHLRLPLPPIVLAVIAALIVPLVARADDGGTVGARVSVANGTVAIQRGDSSAAVAAVVNAPVAGGDYVTTGAQSRAELQFDRNAVVRLGENVQLRVSHIDASGRHLQLAAGTIDVRLFHGTDGTNTIDTPSISVIPKMAGTYRISVDADGTTAVTVRAGDADTTTPQGTQSLEPGTTLIASGAAAKPHISLRDAIAYDDFDQFNDERDRVQVAAAPRYDVPSQQAPIPSYAYVTPQTVVFYPYATTWPRYNAVAPIYVPARPYVLPLYRPYAAYGVSIYGGGGYHVWRSGSAAVRGYGGRGGHR
jgi:hypothetical protein